MSIRFAFTSGSATTNLSISPVATNDLGNYTVVVSNAFGMMTSSVAALTLVFPPTITAEPQGVTLLNGTSGHLGVTVADAASDVAKSVHGVGVTVQDNASFMGKVVGLAKAGNTAVEIAENLLALATPALRHAFDLVHWVVPNP